MEISVESIPELLRATGRFVLVDPAALGALLAEAAEGAVAKQSEPAQEAAPAAERRGNPADSLPVSAAGAAERAVAKQSEPAQGASLRALVPGEVFLREGETGDALFVVLEGSVQVYRDHLSGEVVLARLYPGEHLGEQSLLPGSSGRRSASARAAEAAVVLRIERAAFDTLLQHTDGLVAQLQSAGRAQLLRGLAAHGELFQALVAEQDFGDALREVVVPPGAALMRQGKPADALFLITHGVVGISRREAGKTLQIGQAGVGECVGELGLLQRQPRAATVTALTPVRAVRVDGDWFVRRYADSDRLQAWMGTLEGACRLPARGLVTRHSGQLEGRPALTNLYHFEHRAPVAVTLAVGEPVINAQEVGGVPTLEVGFEAPGVQRTLRLRGSHLVGLSGVGPWPELPAVMERLLDQKPLLAQEIQGFEYGGKLTDEAPAYTDEIICVCLQLPRAVVRRAIRAGCRDLASVQARTGCATVCGGCAGQVSDLLGGQGFLPATIEVIQDHLPDVRSFFVRPAEGLVEAAHPGQHLVVRARIGGDMIERTYTISGVDPEGYEITVKREPHGVFSRWLFENAQATIWHLPPSGAVMWTPGDRPTLAFVAGIGATLAMAITRRASAGDLTTGPVVVHQSARGGFVFDQELADLAGAGRIHLVRRRTDVVGRMTAAEAQALVAQWVGAQVFVCGPPGYVTDVMEALEGLPPERLHVEVFEHAGGPAAVAPVTASDFFLVAPPPDRPWHAALTGFARGAWVSLGKLLPTRKATVAGLDPRLAESALRGGRAALVAQLEALRAKRVATSESERAAEGPESEATVSVVGEKQPAAIHHLGGREAILEILNHSEVFDRGDRVFGGARSVLGGGLLVGSVASDRPDRAIAERAFSPPAIEQLVPALQVTMQHARAELDACVGTPAVDLAAFGSRLAFSFFFRSLVPDLDGPTLVALAADIFPVVDATLEQVHGALHGDPPAVPAALATVLRQRLAGLATQIRTRAEGLSPSQRTHAFVQQALAADFDEARWVELLGPFVVAGHETTGAVLGWLFWELAKRPELEAALLNEIEAFRAEGPRSLRPADYVERPLTLAVFYETVRLHPPLDRLVRTARQATTLPSATGGFSCPAGSVLVAELAALHQDPAVYPEPQAWRPERFLVGIPPRASRREQGQQVWETARAAQARGDFLPFGAGPGRCAGRHLALMEVVCALDGLLPYYHFEVDAERVIAERPGFLNRPPVGGLTARLHRR